MCLCGQSVHCECRCCHQNPEKDTGCPRTGVTGDVSHLTWLLSTIQVFYKSSLCSLLLSHLFSCESSIFNVHHLLYHHSVINDSSFPVLNAENYVCVRTVSPPLRFPFPLVYLCELFSSIVTFLKAARLWGH